MRFREWLNEDAQNYINPDDLLCLAGAVTFLYTADNQKLYTNTDSCSSHTQLVIKYPELRTRYNIKDYIDKEELVGLLKKDVSGRIGLLRGKKTVSFWNHYDDKVEQCIEHLKSKGLIDNSYIISIPGKEVVDLDLWRKLHLMTGSQKHDAMKQLGLGFKGQPNGWQKSGMKAGLLVPGQKWWSPHSESKK